MHWITVKWTKRKILQCMFCASSVEECLLCGSSCSLPTLDWFHTSQCTLAGGKEYVAKLNRTSRADNDTWLSLTYLHSPGNPTVWPCSGRELQQHPHLGLMLLCRKSDLEVQTEGDVEKFLHVATADWTERIRKLPHIPQNLPNYAVNVITMYTKKV